MSAAGRPVPWGSWQEWQHVAACFGAQDHTTIQKGLEKVAAWRCRGRVPLGVDITASLLDIQMRDPAGSKAAVLTGSQPSDDAALRMHYAMIIVRLVNGIADSAQKGRTAVSVASLSEAAGLPRMLVDLRHEATHNELPSLPLLRLAAQQALAWLQASYWQAQSQQLRACALRCEELLQDLLRTTGLAHHPEAMTAVQRSIAMSLQAAQKHQRSVLLELKSLVPAAAAALLVPPLLRPGSVPLPPAHPATTPAVTAPPAAADAGSQHAAAAVDAAAAATAWDSSLAMLQQEWPALPALLLRGAISQLTRSRGSDATTVAHLTSWVRLLLRAAKGEAAAGGGIRKGKGSRKQPAFSWRPSQPQLRQLLAQCLAEMHQQTPDGSVSCTASSHPTELLNVALLLLLEQLEGTADGDGVDTAEPVTIQEAEARQRELLRQRAPPQNSETTASPPAARWHRAESWTPCALGAQPCVHDPNGGSFALDAVWPQAFSPVDVTAGLSGANRTAAENEDCMGEDSAPDYFAQFGPVADSSIDAGGVQPLGMTAGVLQLDAGQISVW